MWELDCEEGWALKNWCFWTVVLEKTLESPLDWKEIEPFNSKRKQSWIFTEGLMLRLKFQYFGHLMWRSDSLEKTLMLGKIEGRRRREQQRMRWLESITDSMDMNLSKHWGDGEESWVPKNWCFWTVVLEKTLESPLDCKEIQPVYPKGNQSWIFIGRTDAEAETPILWPPDAKNWLIWKDPDAGKDWGQEEKGTTEDEMAGWHHWLDGHESEWTLGVGDGQGGLACCDSWGRKESDTTERLNWMRWINLESIIQSEVNQKRKINIIY